MSLSQYQAEIAVLQDKLRVSVQKLEECELRLQGQDEQAQKMLLEYQTRLDEAEERLRRQQDEKDLQMKSIISRCETQSKGERKGAPAYAANSLTSR